MFESGRFESEYYHAQRDFIATVVIIVIAVSIMYFVVVFVSELYTSLAPRKVANRRRGRKDGLKGASSRPLPMDTHKDNADDNEQVEAAEMNPMFIAMQKRAAASGGAAAGAGAGAASSVDRGQLDDLAAAYSKVCAREPYRAPRSHAYCCWTLRCVVLVVRVWCCVASPRCSSSGSTKHCWTASLRLAGEWAP